MVNARLVLNSKDKGSIGEHVLSVSAHKTKSYKIMGYVRLALSIQVRKVHSIKGLEQHVARKNVEYCLKVYLLEGNGRSCQADQCTNTQKLNTDGTCSNCPSGYITDSLNNKSCTKKNCGNRQKLNFRTGLCEDCPDYEKD
jgi:hypothetical protein